MNAQMRRTLAMWRGPILVWLILMLLVVATYAAAVSALPGAWKTVIHFVVVAVQVTLIGVFFMDLRRAQGLPRLAAVAGFYWLFIMFVLAFNDYQSRPLSSPCDAPAFAAASGQCASPVR
jgi:cytochrome c oxidase subunit IV